MNNTFELKRFGLVFKKLFFERYLPLLGSLILALIAAWFIYSVTNRIDTNTFSRLNSTVDPYLIRGFHMAQFEAFSIGLGLGGIYWVFMGFNYFSNKEQGYNYLVLPASYFEKWLSVVVLLGLFVLSFALFFRILDISFIQYLKNQLANSVNIEAKNRFFSQIHALDFFENTHGEFNYPYFILFNITGLMAIGALYFNKTAIIKTVFLAICLDRLLNYLHYLTAKNLFQLDIRTIFNYWAGFMVEKTYHSIVLPKHIQTVYIFIFGAILPIIFWLIALVRLREKEI